MIMYHESMFGRYYCIKTFSHSKTLVTMPRKALFSFTNGTKGMLPANVSKMLFQGKAEIPFASVCITDDDISFCDSPGMLIFKTAKLCIHSM